VAAIPNFIGSRINQTPSGEEFGNKKTGPDPEPVTDTFERVEMRNAPNNAQVGQKTIGKEDACLLLPLTLVHSPTMVTAALQVPEKAKKEYGEACAALKRKKTDSAETHMRKAAQEYPKYSAAWVTLGQIFAAQEKSDELRRLSSRARSNLIQARML
jgi:predicted Zn-dependent protease